MSAEACEFATTRRRRRRDLLRRGRGVGGRGAAAWPCAGRRLLRFLLLLRLGGLGGELLLALAEHFHQLAAGFLVFGVVHRRAVIGLGEARERHGKAHCLLLDVHGSDDHLLALAHRVEHFLGQLHLHLAARREAERVLQLDRLAVVDLDLHAGRDHQRIGGRHPDEKLLLVLALGLTHGGGDQHHAGIGLKALVVDRGRSACSAVCSFFMQSLTQASSGTAVGSPAVAVGSATAGAPAAGVLGACEVLGTAGA